MRTRCASEKNLLCGERRCAAIQRKIGFSAGEAKCRFSEKSAVLRAWRTAIQRKICFAAGEAKCGFAENPLCFGGGAA